MPEEKSTHARVKTLPDVFSFFARPVQHKHFHLSSLVGRYVTDDGQQRRVIFAPWDCRGLQRGAHFFTMIRLLPLVLSLSGSLASGSTEPCELKFIGDQRHVIAKKNPYAACRNVSSLVFQNTDLTNDEVLDILKNVDWIVKGSKKQIEIVFTGNRNIGGRLFQYLLNDVKMGGGPVFLNISDEFNFCMKLRGSDSSEDNSFYGVAPRICDQHFGARSGDIKIDGSNFWKEKPPTFFDNIEKISTQKAQDSLDASVSFTAKQESVTFNRGSFRCYRSFKSLKEIWIGEAEQLNIDDEVDCCMDKQDLQKFLGAVRYLHSTARRKLDQKCGWSKRGPRNYSFEVHHGVLDIEPTDNLTSVGQVKYILDGYLDLSKNLTVRHVAFLAFVKEIRCNSKNTAIVLGNIDIREFDLPSLKYIRDCKRIFKYTGRLTSNEGTRFSVPKKLQTLLRKNIKSYVEFPSKICKSNIKMWNSMRSIVINFRGCTVIEGDVVISGDFFNWNERRIGVLTELMSTVRRIYGTLTIEEIATESFAAFRFLQEVHAPDASVAVRILNNRKLKNLKIFLPVIEVNKEKGIKMQIKKNPLLCKDSNMQFIYGDQFQFEDNSNIVCYVSHKTVDISSGIAATAVYYGCMAGGAFLLYEVYQYTRQNLVNFH
ncbi:unnamed protein product [Caenorhabditis auriculariae]|uniref:Receptor L-domain domain-containing protein n=1 Tax=Caenorhabditis auriculariae TaxID=2777116 RepID=A0A8S1H3X1_9PELO|nr:unnamed protein product [Caenorhabditis auriculariae]